MRALSLAGGAALLIALGATGAVLATSVAAPGRPGPGNASAPARGESEPAPTVRPAAGHTAPAPPARAAGGPITVVVRTATGRVVARSRVGAVDPIPTGSGFAPIDPPDWNQAVWARYRPLVSPADTKHGTAYLYGHACHHHVCAFTRLHEVRPGGTVTVRAGGTSTSYRVTRTSAAFPKRGAGSLASRRSGVANRAIAHRVVLITCAYETGDLSLNNFVVIAVRR